MFDGATEMFFMFLLRVQSDIVVIKIDQRCFLVGSEEVVFPVVVGSLEGLDGVIIEARGAEVSCTNVPIF